MHEWQTMLSITPRRVLCTASQIAIKPFRNVVRLDTHATLKGVTTTSYTRVAEAQSRPLFESRLFSTYPSRALGVHRTLKEPTEPHSTVAHDGSIKIRTPMVEGLVKVTGRLMRDHIQRTPHPPSKDYVTLSFYQFRPIAEEDLIKIQYYFLSDLRAMDVVGRIYISTEGINAQISCPKGRVDEFKSYYSTQWPIFDKIRFNPAMSEGKAFKKLHVRVKTQVQKQNH